MQLKSINKLKIKNIDEYQNDVLYNIKIDTGVDIIHHKNISKYDNSVNNNYIMENKNYNIYNNLKRIDTINHINKFILIIDFPNLGGGTTTFLNNIVEKYKHNNTLIIARNNNNNVHFVINNEYLVNKLYNENESIHFLKENKNKIIKIFVNHTIGHSITFLNNILSLNKEVTTITHDYQLLFNKFNTIYNDMDNYIKKNDRFSIDINKYDTIITQNIKNLYYYKNYIDINKKIIVSPLPDYLKIKDKIITENDDIIIGVIGFIQEHKGESIINNIIKYNNNQKIKFIIFGSINNTNCIQNKYNSIEELNALLIKYKPNVLLEASIWAETYSYTLTLSMLTDLPIIYLPKNNHSVVEDRLSTYNKAYKFNTIKDIYNIINDIKQNYFYTIDNKIYFNSYWDEYFNGI